MHHATWDLVNSTPALARLHKLYRRLPSGFRKPVRWLVKPRKSLAMQVIRLVSHGKVVGGPFRGMIFNSSAPHTGAFYVGFTAGSHEIETRPAVEEIIARRYSTILNVGAADGYFAVGFALRSPSTRVIAFETDTQLQKAMADAANANGVGERVDIRGRCECDDLRRDLDSRPGSKLIFIDIEGGEVDLLDPARVPALRGVDMLIETHDMYVPGCTELLIERFSPTHHVECYRGRKRLPSDFPHGVLPILPHVMPRTLASMMDEGRLVPQDWLYLVSKEPNEGTQGQRQSSSP